MQGLVSRMRQVSSGEVDGEQMIAGMVDVTISDAG